VVVVVVKVLLGNQWPGSDGVRSGGCRGKAIPHPSTDETREKEGRSSTPMCHGSLQNPPDFSRFL